MAQTAPPPLDPKMANLLRTAPFEAPPLGAKRRVRRRLEIAGVLSMARAGAGPIATPPQKAFARGAPAPGKFAFTAMAAVAIGAAGALLFAREASPPLRPVRPEDLGARPGAVFEVAVAEPTQEVEQYREELATAPSVSAPLPLRSALPGTRRSTADSLGLEQRLLARARAALGRGELESAARELDRHARLLPIGHLTEEREALRIVTLAQQGNLTAARERAGRFRRLYPRSIQMSTVEGAVAERL